jgi:hypothetical protein
MQSDIGGSRSLQGKDRAVFVHEGWLASYPWKEDRSGAKQYIPATLSLKRGSLTQGDTASLPLGTGLMTKC